MKKAMILCALLTLLLAGALTGKAEAAEIVYSGDWGENLSWTLDDEGVLTISGTGDIGSTPSAVSNVKSDVKRL